MKKGNQRRPMKAVSSTNRGEHRSIWRTVGGVSNSLFSGSRPGKTATQPRSKKVPFGEFLLDNMDFDLGYAAAIEDIEELLLRTELLADCSERLFVASRHQRGMR